MENNIEALRAMIDKIDGCITRALKDRQIGSLVRLADDEWMTVGEMT